jgi:hypothetical protein
MKAKPSQIIKVMDILNDPFIKDFDKPDARERVAAELKTIDAIEASEIVAEQKCEQLFELLGHNIERAVAQEPAVNVSSKD